MKGIPRARTQGPKVLPWSQAWELGEPWSTRVKRIVPARNRTFY